MKKTLIIILLSFSFIGTGIASERSQGTDYNNNAEGEGSYEAMGAGTDFEATFGAPANGTSYSRAEVEQIQKDLNEMHEGEAGYVPIPVDGLIGEKTIDAFDTAPYEELEAAKSDTPKPMTVIVTEKIPGTDCTPVGSGNTPETRKYKCTIKPGFQTAMELIGGLIKYATFISALIGVLMLTASGIHLSMSGIDSGAKAKAKEQFTKIIGGLVLLFLIGFVLNTVAPWIYT
ncbi:MAG: hypothetical protein PHS92_05590 [Candidatus Gracilibacteria bacterium]|nr:hypothetical protein [Candidatus Gracilibacteria bacterium]